MTPYAPAFMVAGAGAIRPRTGDRRSSPSIEDGCFFPPGRAAKRRLARSGNSAIRVKPFTTLTMGRRSRQQQQNQISTGAPSTTTTSRPAHHPLTSPKSNLVSNVQALKGTGITKVGESFDDDKVDDTPIQALRPSALVLPDALFDKKPAAAAARSGSEESVVVSNNKTTAKEAVLPIKKVDSKGRTKKHAGKTPSPPQNNSSSSSSSKPAVAPTTTTTPPDENDNNNRQNSSVAASAAAAPASSTAPAADAAGGAVATAPAASPTTAIRTKKVSQSSAEAVLSVFASSSLLPSLVSSPHNGTTVVTDDGGSRSTKPASPRSKKTTEGTAKRGFKWFRKGRKSDMDATAMSATQQQQQPPHHQQQQQQDSKAAASDLVTRSPRTPRNIFAVLRNPTPSEVTKETTDTPTPAALPAGPPLPQPPTFTSPLRMQLWLGVVQRSIVKVVDPASLDNMPAVYEEQVMSEDQTMPEDRQQRLLGPSVAAAVDASVPHQSSSFYRHTRDTGVYVDYSTFDDGESISSIDLLFKWLTCRDLTAPDKPNRNGSTITTDDNVQVESDVSFDPEAQPRRRVLFSP
jgi:hypothetical protein